MTRHNEVQLTLEQHEFDCVGGGVKGTDSPAEWKIPLLDCSWPYKFAVSP